METSNVHISHQGTKVFRIPRPAALTFKPSILHKDYIEFRGSLTQTDLRSLPVFVTRDKSWVSPGMNAAFWRNYNNWEKTYRLNFINRRQKFPWLSHFNKIRRHLREGDKLLSIVNHCFLPVQSITRDSYIQTGNDTYVEKSILFEIIKILFIERKGKITRIVYNDGESSQHRNYNNFGELFVLTERSTRWKEPLFSKISHFPTIDPPSSVQKGICPSFILYDSKLANNLSWEIFRSQQQEQHFPLIDFHHDVVKDIEGIGQETCNESKVLDELLEADPRLRKFHFNLLETSLRPNDRIVGLYADIYNNMLPTDGGIRLLVTKNGHFQVLTTTPTGRPLCERSAKKMTDLFFFIEREDEEIAVRYTIG